ncbi:MAG: phosphatidylglycerophosphatase [Sediminibacterium sp.]|nr:phosphatidylglycerophosphatase [Sediminibacterium sp.]
MMNIYKWISSCFGIGYLKGGGTVAAMITCLLWWLVQRDGNFNSAMIVVTAAITIIGIWSSTMVEKDWGKDSGKVVIDEVAGMCISLLFVPITVQWIVIALVLFRFFDIVKLLYIRKAEALPGGWGVMTDDILAGVYSNIVLQLIIYFI